MIILCVIKDEIYGEISYKLLVISSVTDSCFWLDWIQSKIQPH